MAVQSLFFISDAPIRAEFEIHFEEAGGVFALTPAFNPRRDEPLSVYASADELADAIEALVREHFRDHRASVRLIRYREKPEHITVAHLGRFGVPLFPIDTGD